MTYGDTVSHQEAEHTPRACAVIGSRDIFTTLCAAMILKSTLIDIHTMTIAKQSEGNFGK